MLKSMKVVVFGGASLSKDIGNTLIDSGVNLTQFYGRTSTFFQLSKCTLILSIYYSIETGCLTPYLPLKSLGKDWEYFRFSKHCHPVLAEQSDLALERVHSLTLVESPTHTPCFINTTVDGMPAYEISDLLERHPSNPELWRVFGRADDLIVLSNALKVVDVSTPSITKQSCSLRCICSLDVRR